MARKAALAASKVAPRILRGSLFATLFSPFAELKCTRDTILNCGNEILETQRRG